MSSKIEQIARKIVKEFRAGKISSQTIKKLDKAVKDSEDTDLTRAYRAAAMDHWASEDIEIDKDAIVSIGEDGAFVAGWLWVAKEGDK